MNYSKISNELQKWYSLNARDLPWRKTRDPYSIWVSEIMLQQTQVIKVIDFYQRWMKRFPDIDALASAPLEEVNRYWAGLGYYRRAKFLWESAKHLVETNPLPRGKAEWLPRCKAEWLPRCKAEWLPRCKAEWLPRCKAEWLTVKGVGEYTASAISAIALGEPVAVVDGNVERVWARLHLFSRTELGMGGFKQSIDKISKQIEETLKNHPEISSSKIAQGFMELGATVCTPVKPDCEICPISKNCLFFKDARKQPDMDLRYPGPKPRAEKKHLKEERYVYVYPEKKLVLVEAHPEARWRKGLYELPLRPVSSLEKLCEESSTRFVEKSVVTHHQIESTVILKRLTKKTNFKTEKDYQRWIEYQNNLQILGLSAPTLRILRRVFE